MGSSLVDFLSNPTGWIALLMFAGIFLFYGIVLLRENVKYRDRNSILSLYSQDLTALAQRGKLDPVVGRNHEIERVIEILGRRTKNNAILVGESGVGKTAIVEGLASLIAKDQVPPPLRGKKILALDLSGLLAGTKYRGEFEKRLKSILDEVIAAQRKLILFIDEIHTLAAAGEATGAINAADILKPALARGELQAIGATTEKEYADFVQKDETLERRFQPVAVTEPSPEETRNILLNLRPRYEKHHQVKITDATIDAAVKESVHRLPGRHLPDKAIDAMDEAAARARLQSLRTGPKGATPVVNPADIDAVVTEWAHDLECFTHNHKNKGRTSPATGAQPSPTGA